jgi:hypothetical protein
MASYVRWRARSSSSAKAATFVRASRSGVDRALAVLEAEEHADAGLDERLERIGHYDRLAAVADSSLITAYTCASAMVQPLRAV